MSNLVLHLLGPFQAFINDQPLEGFEPTRFKRC